MLLNLFIAVVIIIVIYQAVFYWIFKDPVSIKGSVKNTNTINKVNAKEVSFKINNRINESFPLEKIILRIGEHHHILNNYQSIDYPAILKGFETFTLKLPVDFLQQLLEKDSKDWRKMLNKISITIRGNNASYRSNQIHFS